MSDPIYTDRGLAVRQRVKVKPHISAPEWATEGMITALPPRGSDFYDHPAVLWDSDLRVRHVASNWLVVTGFTCPKCGMTSHNPADGDNTYCSACNMFFGGVHR